MGFPDRLAGAAESDLEGAQLADPPARVLEVGCGPLGGFVPALRSAGYAATGVDPQAPEAPGYFPVEFERHHMALPADAIVACTSLHHVADLGEVLDLVRAALVPGGVLVVVEWALERFDEATARWCFGRLTQPGDDPGWLHRRRAQWRDSGWPWEAYWQSWAAEEDLHADRDILRVLDTRFNFPHAATPLKPLPEPVDLEHRVRRQTRADGTINEYCLVA